MESLPKDMILEYNSDTLQAVRKLYGMDKPNEMAEAINLLDDWVKKQNHFVKKDFNKEYLERTIIACKGSVERAKLRLDKICTFRTLMPHYFKDSYIKDFKNYFLTPLPKLTKDNERICVTKYAMNEYSSSIFHASRRYSIMVYEYLRAHDYATSLIMVVDLMEVNLAKILSEINITEMSQIKAITSEGYGNPVKGIHLLSSSKLIHTLVLLLKQIGSAKFGERIKVHRTMETVYEFVPKDLLPMEYGGKERSVIKLNDDWFNVLSSEEFRSYHKEINKACTDETCRNTEEFNQQYLGMPGTFRSLSVD